MAMLPNVAKGQAWGGKAAKSSQGNDCSSLILFLKDSLALKNKNILGKQNTISKENHLGALCKIEDGFQVAWTLVGRKERDREENENEKWGREAWRMDTEKRESGREGKNVNTCSQSTHSWNP